jgi:hypothetical protein
MSLKIVKLIGQAEPGQLNTEWMLVKNDGENPFNAEGCSISLAKGSGRPHLVTTFQAGIIIKPKEICRLITGSSGKKAHGEAPTEENIRNIHLYLKANYLDKSGLVVRIMNKQMEVCRAIYDPKAQDGILSECN